MKKLITVITPTIIFLSFGTQAATIEDVTCVDNSIDFTAEASNFDSSFGNRVFVQLSTSPTYRTYTKSQQLIVTENQSYSFDFKAMIKNSNQADSYGISYFIFDSFGSINITGQCS